MSDKVKAVRAEDLERSFVFAGGNSGAEKEFSQEKKRFNENDYTVELAADEEIDEDLLTSIIQNALNENTSSNSINREGERFNQLENQGLGSRRDLYNKNEDSEFNFNQGMSTSVPRQEFITSKPPPGFEPFNRRSSSMAAYNTDNLIASISNANMFQSQQGDGVRRASAGKKAPPGFEQRSMYQVPPANYNTRFNEMNYRLQQQHLSNDHRKQLFPMSAPPRHMEHFPAFAPRQEYRPDVLEVRQNFQFIEEPSKREMKVVTDEATNSKQTSIETGQLRQRKSSIKTPFENGIINEPYSLIQFRNTSDKSQRHYIKGSKRMTGAELFHLVRISNFSLEINENDPYSSDYYFIKFKEHRNRELLKQQRKPEQKIKIFAPNEIIRDMTVMFKNGKQDFTDSLREKYTTSYNFPAPNIVSSKANTSKGDEKSFTEKQKESKQRYQQLINSWQKENQVLGQIPKSSVKAPKLVVNLGLTDIALSNTTPDKKFVHQALVNQIGNMLLEIEEISRALHFELSSLSPTSENTIYNNLSSDHEALVQKSKQNVDTLEKKQVSLANELAMALGFDSILEENISLSKTFFLNFYKTNLSSRRMLPDIIQSLLPEHKEILINFIFTHMADLTSSDTSTDDQGLGNLVVSEIETMKLRKITKMLEKFLAKCCHNNSVELKKMMSNNLAKVIIPRLLIRGVDIAAKLNKSQEDKNEKLEKKWQEQFQEFINLSDG